MTDFNTPHLQLDVLPGMASAFAPTGRLRAAINLGNPILANRNPATGQPFGVSIDLANELARQLGVGIERVVFDGAAKSVDAVSLGHADIGFFAVDPLRGAGLHFTAPYILIEGSYLVRNASPLQSNAQVDAVGHRVAVGQGSAYDLFLTRELKHAQVVRGDGAQGAVAAFEGQNLDALAGIRLMLEEEATQKPGLRLLPGRFMVIQQAMGCPKVRSDAVAEALRAFVERMKSSGFVAEAMQRHGVVGASVAGPVV